MTGKAWQREPRRLNLADFGTCECGKLRYASRKAAKGAIKRLATVGRVGTVKPYRCHIESDYFHMGHQPSIITRGDIASSDFDPTLRGPRSIPA